MHVLTVNQTTNRQESPGVKFLAKKKRIKGEDRNLIAYRHCYSRWGRRLDETTSKTLLTRWGPRVQIVKKGKWERKEGTGGADAIHLSAEEM